MFWHWGSSPLIKVYWLDQSLSAAIIATQLLEMVIDKSGSSRHETFVSPGRKLRIWSTTLKMQFMVCMCVTKAENLCISVQQNLREGLLEQKDWHCSKSLFILCVCVCVCVHARKCVTTNSQEAPVCLDWMQLAGWSPCCHHSTNTHTCANSPKTGFGS